MHELNLLFPFCEKYWLKRHLHCNNKWIDYSYLIDLESQSPGTSDFPKSEVFVGFGKPDSHATLFYPHFG